MTAGNIAVTDRLHPTAAKQGEYVARYTYLGQPDSDKFEVDIIIGDLARDGLGYDEELEEHIGHIASAAKVTSTQRYRKDGVNSLGIVVGLRHGTSFGYNDAMLLRNLVDAAGAADAVATLSDRTALEEANHAWQVSVVGLSGIRAMQRQLFVASGEVELNVPIPEVPRPMTDPQLRTATLNVLGAITLDVFLSMPPQPLH